MSSNIVRRLKTAAIAIPIVLAGLYFPLMILLICVVVCFVGLREFSALRTEILNNLYNLINNSSKLSSSSSSSSSSSASSSLASGGGDGGGSDKARSSPIPGCNENNSNNNSNNNNNNNSSSSSSSTFSHGSGPDIVISHDVQIGIMANGSTTTAEKSYPTEDKRLQTIVRCILGTSLVVVAFFSTYEEFYTFANYSLFEFGLSVIFLLMLLWSMLSAGAPDAIPDAQQLVENGVFVGHYSSPSSSSSAISSSSMVITSSSHSNNHSNNHNNNHNNNNNPNAVTSATASTGSVTPVHMPLSMRAFIELAFDVFGTLYMALPMSFGIMLYNKSAALFTLVLLCNWAGDAAALFVGRSIGRHKLYPKISPNKTIEGFCGALMGAMLSGTLFFYIWETFFFSRATRGSSSISNLSSMDIRTVPPLFRVEEFMVIGLLVGVLGAAGDLVKSYMKRVARVKDAGNFFGAHGGVIDRIDGLLFAFGPVYFLYIFLMS